MSKRGGGGIATVTMGPCAGYYCKTANYRVQDIIANLASETFRYFMLLAIIRVEADVQSFSMVRSFTPTTLAKLCRGDLY